MKNKEKFAEEIVEIACTGNSIAKIKGVLCCCETTSCDECDFKGHPEDCDPNVKKWAESEYVEPRYETDWASVPVDTPVYLKGTSNDRGYFSKMLSDGRLAIYPDGRTSWSSDLAIGALRRLVCGKSDVVLAREEDKLKYRKRVN